MAANVSRIAESVMCAARTLQDSLLMSANDFIHLAERSVINKTLSKLAQQGKLMRVTHGLYALPIEGKFGLRPPTTESVVNAIEAVYGEVVVAGGAAEAHALGITAQVPVREVFYTSGRSRKLRVGNRQVELKHVNHCHLLHGKRLAGKAIRILLWLGQDGALEAASRLRTQLPQSEWEAIKDVQHLLPSWLSKIISAS